jgi:beta-phosphoglucomutase
MGTTARALLLDLDGVVTDTARAHGAAWRTTLAAHGLRFDPEAYARTRGRSRADSLRELVAGQDVRPDVFETMLAEKDAAYRAALSDLGPDNVLPGATQLIADARARGWPVAIASSSRNAGLVLGRLGLADRFDAVADGTAGAPKPAPDIFLAAAAAVGVPPAACVAVDDGGAGVDAALAAGMLVVGVGPAAEVGHAHARVDTTADLDLDRILAALGAS